MIRILLTDPDPWIRNSDYVSYPDSGGQLVTDTEHCFPLPPLSQKCETCGLVKHCNPNVCFPVSGRLGGTSAWLGLRACG